MAAAGEAKKVALVTGASYGVGAAAAQALSRDGFAVALTATRITNLEATRTEIAANGGLVHALELDLNIQESIERAVADTVQALGRIDVLVNNAAVNLRRLAVDVTRADWDDLMRVNLTGTFFLTQQVARHLIARGAEGRIVTVASGHAFIGAAERSAYGISKAALVQMTRMLAIEWAEHGIRVNAVAPGRLDTPSPSRAARTQNQAYMDAMLKKIPLHRLATAEEIGDIIAFLASPAAASITGQTIVVDGGLTAA